MNGIPVLCVEGKCIAEAWETVLRHNEALETSGQLAARREEQARAWMWTDLQERLLADLKQDPAVRKRVADLEEAVGKGKTPAATAAEKLLNIYLKHHRERD